MGEIVNFSKYTNSEILSEDCKEIEVLNNTYVSNSTEIYKSNRLIESSYRLSTAQSRLLYLAMLKFKKIILNKNLNMQQVEDALHSARFEDIYIDVIDYKKTFNINANNLYIELAKVARELFNQEILYYEGEGKIINMRWVDTCEYDFNKKSVALTFNPKLIKDLMIFKNKFTIMQFDTFVNMKGKYSFRIYELCKQYLKLTRRDLSLEDLRFKLGIKDEEYRLYTDFKKGVLNPSIKEINKYSDICIDFEEIEKDKKTRKVKKLRFNIKENTQRFNLQETVIENQISLFGDNVGVDIIEIDEEYSIVENLSNIIGLSISAGEADAILTASLEAIDKKKLDIGAVDYIKHKSEICKKYAKTHVVGNPVGLLITSIEKDYKTKEIASPKLDKPIRVAGINTAKEFEDYLLGR